MNQRRILPTRLRSLAVIAAAAALVLSACGSPATAPPDVSPSVGSGGCIADFDPNADYFPVKQELEFAKNFTLTYEKSYQVLTVEQPMVDGLPETYVLTKCGAPAPELTGDLAGAQQLTTPVKSLFSASTTHIASLEALDSLNLVTGIATKAYISSKAAQERAADPDVVEFAPAGTADTEQIVSALPDVLITGGIDDPGYATVRDAGIPVLAGAEFLEADPLGQAEWIKFFAALTGTEEQATSTFTTIVDDYQSAVAQAANAEPTEVLVSQPDQGAWRVPAGGSYVGRMITDAKGTWPWIDDKSTGTVSTDLETVFDKSGTAPIWLTSSNWTTTAEALAEEPRFADFASFKSGQVWAPSLQVNAAGGNNYFELGVLRPDLIVSDLMAILHPELLPDHTFTFYQKLK